MAEDAQIVSGGESLSVFEIMQRFRNDGSCEHIIKDALERLARSSDASKEYVRGLGVTSEVANKLLNIREALARNDVEDAWLWLYKIADPKVGGLTPWKELEAAALISQHQEGTK